MTVNSNNQVQLKVDDLHLRFGGLVALSGISTEVKKGEILAIIGPNGAGKTSFVNCVGGFYRPQQGRVLLEGRNITKLSPHKICELGVARTFQNIELFTGMSVLDNLLAARHIYMRYDPISSAIFFGRARRTEIRERKIVEEIIDFLEMEAIRKAIVGSLPYGLRKRVELGRALAIEPKILFLDEPMTGMNVEEKEDMARFILDIHELRGTTIALVEHDMGVVMDIAQRIVVLDFGHKIAEGSPEEIMKDEKVIKAYLGAAAL